MGVRLSAGQQSDIVVDQGTIKGLIDNNDTAALQNKGFGAILVVETTATVEVSSEIQPHATGGWTPLLRADTGAAVTALAAGSYPIAMTFNKIRVTAGSINIRPLTRSQ